jgi:hypothetical protein
MNTAYMGAIVYKMANWYMFDFLFIY